MISERDFVLGEGPADDFVDGVVAADVFADDDEFAITCKKTGGVESTGTVEDALRGAEFFGELQEGRGGNLEGRGLPGGTEKFGADFVDGGFSTDAATGIDVEVSAGGWVEGGGRAELDIERVLCLLCGDFGGRLGFLNGENLAGRLDHTFGEEEASGELGVITGSAHGDGEGFAIDTNLERFFAGEGILKAPGATIGVFSDLS